MYLMDDENNKQVDLELQSEKHPMNQRWNQQKCNQNQMEEQEETEHDEDIQCRVLTPSLFNKSSIHTVNLSNSMLVQLPAVSANTQKLIVTYNMLSQFPTGLTNLKQISISNNCIERLPQEINGMECLRIIRANNNQIAIVPFLRLVRHLELNKNPIKLITANLSQTRIQHLSFDWLPFLIFNHPTLQNHESPVNEQHIVYELCDLISQVRLDSIQEFVDFDALFEANIKSRTDVSLDYLLHRAVGKKSDFFIDFLKNNYASVNFNDLYYGDKLVLHEILEQNYEKALELFKMRRSNINEVDVFMNNLLLSCRFNNMELFNFMVKNGLKRHTIQQNEEEIIETIFRNFDSEMHSEVMLAKILQLANFTKLNKKIFHLPRNYSLREAESISQAILYVMKNDSLNQLFSFEFAVWGDILQPLLHFAMASRRSALVKIILDRYKSPFVKNYAGKMAKTIRGSVLCRKLISKYEKLYISHKFDEENEAKPQKNKINSERWFEIVYDKNDRGHSYGTPIKYKSLDQTVCMAPKLQSAERLIHKRNILPDRVSTQPKPKPKLNLSISLSIPSLNSEQETGIIYEFALGKDKIGTNFPALQHRTNNLAMYQAYHHSLLTTFARDYEKQGSEVVSKSFIFSPLSICQDVQFEEDQPTEHQRWRSNSLCVDQRMLGRRCRDGKAQDVEIGEVKLNQQF